MTIPTGEEYVRSLERRVAEQRRELRRLTAFDNDGGEHKARANRQARQRIAKLERVIGIQAVKLQEQYHALRLLKGVDDPTAEEVGEPQIGEASSALPS